MSLKKEERAVLQRLNKKNAKADNAMSESVKKNYVFKIIAANLTRETAIEAATKSEAEAIMFERYGDLPYELIEVR